MRTISTTLRLAPLTVVGLLAAFPLAGCTAGAEEDDDLGSIEQEKRVKPKGNEQHTTGTVTVKVPDGAPLLAVTNLEFRKAGQPASAPAATGLLDKPVTLPIGTYDLRVHGSNAATVFASIEIKGGQAAVVTLPVLAPIALTTTAKPAAAVPTTYTYGPGFNPQRGEPTRLAPQLRVVGPASVYTNPIGVKTGIVLVPNTTYEVFRPTGSGDAVLHTLTVGATPQVHTLGSVSDAWLAPPMDVPTSSLKIVVDASDFPLAQSPFVTWQCSAASDASRNYASAGGSSQKALRGTNAVSTAETITAVVPTPGCKYALQLASGALPIDTTQPQANAAVHYLDIEHVHLTHQDGSVRDVPGKYRLARIPGPGQAPVHLTQFAYATNTAIPVAPGTYLVEVSYTDNSGAKIYAEEVTVP